MAKIKKVEILKVEVYGFRGFEKLRTFNIAREGKSVFLGENGQGKSSLGEAIAWCFTGRSIAGNQKGLNIINDKSKTACVTVTFNDQDGNIHELRRKANPSASIKFDLQYTTQEKLKEIIDTDIFLTIFNPLYYLSLDSNSARNAIYSIIPPISKSDVFSKMLPMEKDLLEKEKFDEANTNEYLKNRRKELKNIENDRKYLEGYIGKLKNEVINVPGEMKFDDSKLSQKEKELEELNNKKVELIDISKLLVLKSDLEKKILRIKSEKFESENLIIKLKGKKALLEQELKNWESKVFTPEDVSDIEKKVAELRADYKALAKEHKYLQLEKEKLNGKKIAFKKGDTCPLCKQSISEQSVDTLNAELKKEVEAEKEAISKKQMDKKKSLEDLEREGKEFLETIRLAKEKEEKARTAFEAKKAEQISALKAQIEKINNKLKNIDKLKADFYKEQEGKINNLLAEIKALGIEDIQSKNKDIQNKFDEEIKREKTELLKAISELRKEKEIVIKNEANRVSLIKRLENNKKEIEQKEKEMVSLSEKERQINDLIVAMKNYNAQKATILDSVVSKYLKDVSLKLVKIVESTGEVKDVFELVYQGKDLKSCSTSETIRAGLEISNMISNLTGYEFPVFVDNSESITSYDEPDTQIIEVKVAKGVNLSYLAKDGSLTEIVEKPIPRAKNFGSRRTYYTPPVKDTADEIEEIA